MAKLTSAELLETQKTYLTREIKTHERDITLAEGKVQENRELLERIENTCLFCGDMYRNWSDQQPTRMEQHISNQHPKEVPLEGQALPVDYMGQETKGESERSRA
jgi:hypothetical protein